MRLDEGVLHWWSLAKYAVAFDRKTILDRFLICLSLKYRVPR